MDKRITKWITERAEELGAIWTQLIPLIVRGLGAAFVVWGALYAFTFFTIGLGIGIAYLREEKIMLDKFFPPYFIEAAIYVTLALIVYQILATVSKKLRSLKREADKYNWNDVNISYEYFEENAGCKIKIKNDKATGLYFLVEIQYLELDGVREDYVVPGKSRILLWVPNPAHNIKVKDSNWQFGFAVNSGDGGKSDNIGLFELSNVIENAQSIKHRIVSCDWSENETKRPPRKYGYFTKFAQGELKICGTNLCASGLSSCDRKYGTKGISENLIYKFRIDAKNNQQVMTKFEPGTQELHADSEEEAKNEG